MAGVGEAAEGMIRGRLTPAIPDALKAYKQGFTQKEWDTLDVKGKPLYYEHDQTKKIGEITNKWSEGGWLGIDALVYKSKPEVKPYYEEIIGGKAGGLSIGFWSDPADVYQPIKWKRFSEASVTKDPADPGARIFVARNKDGVAVDNGGANHSIVMPFTVVKPGETLPPPPEQKPETSPGQDQAKQPEKQEQKTGATSTEAPKSTTVEAPSTAPGESAKVSTDAQPKVTTLSTSPNTTPSPPAPPPASESKNISMADAASSAPAQTNASAGQQAPPAAGAASSTAQQSAPKTQHTLTNNSVNQPSGQEQQQQTKSTKSEEAPATDEQKNLFRDLQKLLKEKASKQADKDAAKAKEAAEKKTAETPAPPAQKEEKPKAAQNQTPPKKQAQQQPPADEEMPDQDAEEDEAEEPEQKPKKNASSNDDAKISQKEMNKMLKDMAKRIEYFEKKEQEAEAKRQAELEAEYDQNFNTFVEADKELKLIPDSIKDKAHEQIRAIFHTPEYSEAQQVIGSMLAKLATVQEQKPAEDESVKGKKRGRADEKTEAKKVNKTPQKKAPAAQEADDDDEEVEDLASAAGFKVPRDALPDILSKKLAKAPPKTSSSMMKSHADAYSRNAPPVLVQRNSTRASTSSTSSVYSQFGDSNSRKAFEFLTQATAGYDAGKHKAMREEFEKKQRLRAEGII